MTKIFAGSDQGQRFPSDASVQPILLAIDFDIVAAAAATSPHYVPSSTFRSTHPLMEYSPTGGRLSVVTVSGHLSFAVIALPDRCLDCKASKSFSKNIFVSVRNEALTTVQQRRSHNRSQEN